MPLRAVDRSLGGRVGAARRWSRLAPAERAAAMAPAREAAERRFMREAEALYPGMGEQELRAVAAELRAAFFADLSVRGREAYARRRAERTDTGGPGRAMPGSPALPPAGRP